MDPILPPLNIPEEPASSSGGPTFFQQEFDRIKQRNDSQLPLNVGIHDAVNPPVRDPNTLSQGFADMLKSTDEWASDPYSYGKPFSFGAGERAMNFDRYYSHSGFKKLGFSPFRDNELVYNKNTSFLADWGRAFPQILKLSWEGAKDMFSEWGSWGGEPDTEMAEKMNHAMGIGNSTRGGVSGWINNFGVNLGYTAGVLAEWAAEEIALTLATAATVGAAAPETVPLGGARAGVMATKVGRAWSNERATLRAMQAASSPSEVGRLAKLGNRAADFLNPFEHTTKFLKTKDLEDYGKTVRGAASLFRDLKAMNAVSSEAKLEAGTTKNDVTNDLLNKFYADNNRLPVGDEITKIHDTADKAAFWDMMGNLPLIYGTNKIVFDQALAGVSIGKPGKELLENMAAKKTNRIITKDLDWKAKGLAQPVNVASIWSKAGFKELMKPGHVLKGTLKYTSANFAEGFQENLQDVMHNSMQDYYEQIYKDPTLASLKYSFGRGLASQVSSQGADTFFSGFLMGGALQGIQKPLFNTLPQLAKKVFTPEKYKTWKQDKEDTLNNFVNAANDVIMNPGRYESAFKQSDKNFVQQVLSKREAERNKTSVKGTMDAKDESAFHNTITLMRSGQMDFFTDYIKDLHKMSDKELTEAFNKEEGPDASGLNIRERLSNFEKKVNQVKNIWEKQLRDLPNPVPIAQANKDPEARAMYDDFEAYREMAAFSHYSFERVADRISSIHNKAMGDKVLSKASASEFAILYSPSEMKDHLRALNSEISLLKSDPLHKRELKQKEARLEAIKDYMNDMYALQTTLKFRQIANANREKTNAKLGLTGNEALIPFDDIIAEHNGRLFNSFKAYVNTIASENNEPVLESVLQDTFQQIKDFYELEQDHIDYARAVNMISNPEFITEFLSRVRTVRSELDSRQTELAREGLATFIDRAAQNEFLNQFYKIGVYVLPEDIDNLLAGNIPKTFLDVTTEKPIDDPVKMQEILRIISQYKTQVKGEPAPVTSPVTAPVESTQSAGVVIEPAVTTQLVTEFLRINQERLNNNEPPIYAPSPVPVQDSIAFKDWVKTSPQAQDILKGKVEPTIPEGFRVVTEGEVIPAGDYNTHLDITTGKVITNAPVKVAVIEEPPAETHILPEFKGKIVFLSAGTGKTTLANKYPEEVVDGDQLLFDFLIKKEIPHTDSQHSGLDFWKYLNKHKMEESDLIAEFQNMVISISKTGKAILTASKYLRPIADKVYISRDVDRIAKVLEERGQRVDDAREAAAKHTQESLEIFKGRKILPIGEGVFAEHILTGVTPEAVPVALPSDFVKRADKINSLTALKEFEQELLKEVRKGMLTAEQGEQIISNRRKELASQIAFDLVNKGDILIMRDKETFGKKGYGKVISKTDEHVIIGKWYPSMKKNPSSGVLLEPSEVKDNVELIYKEGMNDADVLPTITPSDEAIAKVNTEEEQAIIDLEESIKKTLGIKPDDEIANDFFNNKDCE